MYWPSFLLMLIRHHLRPVTVLIFLYATSYTLNLLNRGVFWDGWTIFNVPPEGVLNEFTEAGYGWFGWFLSGLVNMPNGVELLHGIAFASYLGAGLFLWQILRSVHIVRQAERFWITALFLIFPVNFARVDITTSGHALSLLLFFMGWYLLDRYFNTKRWPWRLLASPTFLFAFFLNSLLVFYLIVILYLGYRLRTKFWPWTTFLRSMLMHVDLFALPIIFWILKTTFFQPYGLFAGYNAITLEYILQSPFQLRTAIQQSFIGPIMAGFDLTVAGLAGVIILAAVLYAIQPKEFQGLQRRHTDLFAGGIVLMVLAIFPYLATGKMPGLADWDSRHQILVPLGAAVSIVFGVKLLTAWHQRLARFGTALLCVAASLFVVTNIGSYWDYQRDWLKQASLIEHLRNNERFRFHNTFLIDDRTMTLNARSRKFRFYEYTGVMTYALGTPSRFAQNLKETQAVDQYRKFFEHPQYSLSQYEPREPELIVQIHHGALSLSTDTMISLLADEWFRPTRFRQRVRGVLRLEYATITQ